MATSSPPPLDVSPEGGGGMLDHKSTPVAASSKSTVDDEERNRQMPTSQETAHAHYVRNLEEHVLAGALTQAQMDELLSQKALFDAARADIRANHEHKVVGYCNGEMYVGDTVHLLLAQTKAAHPGKLTYFENIGYKFNDDF